MLERAEKLGSVLVELGVLLPAKDCAIGAPQVGPNVMTAILKYLQRGGTELSWIREHLGEADAAVYQTWLRQTMVREAA